MMGIEHFIHLPWLKMLASDFLITGRPDRFARNQKESLRTSLQIIEGEENVEKPR